MKKMLIPEPLLISIQVIQAVTFPFFVVFLIYLISSLQSPNYLLTNDLQYPYFVIFIIIIPFVHIGLFLGIAIMKSLKDAFRFLWWLVKFIWDLFVFLPKN